MNTIAKKVNTTAAKSTRAEKGRAFDEALSKLFIAELETFRKCGKWLPAWSQCVPFNAVTGKAYRGGNILRLALAFWSRGATSTKAAFLTFNQARQAGGHVKRGAHGTQIAFFKVVSKQGANPDGLPVPADFDFSEIDTTYPFLQLSTVFHIDDCEGVHTAAIADTAAERDAAVRAQHMLDAAGIKVMLLSKVLEPSIINDVAYLPCLGRVSADKWSTMAVHVLVRWTAGHGCERKGFEKYKYGFDHAIEGLITELATAFACARLDLPFAYSEVGKYASRWESLMSRNPELARKASSLASRIADKVCELDARATTEAAAKDSEVIDAEVIQPVTPEYISDKVQFINCARW